MGFSPTDSEKKADFWDIAEEIAELPQELLSKYCLGVTEGRNDDISPCFLESGTVGWETLEGFRKKRGSLRLTAHIRLYKREKEAKDSLQEFVLGDESIGRPSMLMEDLSPQIPELTQVDVGALGVGAVSREWIDDKIDAEGLLLRAALWLGNKCTIAFYRDRVFIWLTMSYESPIFVLRRSKRNPLFSSKDDFVRAGIEIAEAIDENIIDLERRGLL